MLSKCCYNCSKSEGCGEDGVVFCRILQKRMSEADCCIGYASESHIADPYE